MTLLPSDDILDVNVAPVVAHAAWARFEASWYRRSYPFVAAAIKDGQYSNEYDYYESIGAALGHSPNPWFDELWYLSTYPEVMRAVKRGEWASGFDHYKQVGYTNFSPHWLFSEKYYRRMNPDVTHRVIAEKGKLNGYDHFLSGGEAGFRSGSRFFDPHVVAVHASSSSAASFRTLGREAGRADTWFSLLLDFQNGFADGCRSSWYFDPVWYLHRYPEVAEQIKQGEFACALHHYLMADDASTYDPQDAFSEAFYAEAYPDVAASIKVGQFRNGFDHFLRAGAREGRLPVAGCDLEQYATRASVRADIENGLFLDPYAHWVASRSADAVSMVPTQTAEAYAKAHFIDTARSTTTFLGRRPLNFTCDGPPAVSVIVVLHNHFPLTMGTLASLRDNFGGNIELILVDSGSTDETKHIARYVRGARIIPLRYNAGFVRACNVGLAEVTAPVTLYLNNDVLLAPGALANALERLASSSNIGAVGGKIVRTNGLLQEAGSIIWRDGSTFGYLRDGDPNCAEANFVRDVDYCSAAFLLVSTIAVKALDGFDPRYCPAYFEDTDLCARLIEQGFRIVYDPSVVIEHLEYGSSNSGASHALMQRNRRVLAASRGAFLRNQLPAHSRNVIMARTRKSAGARILFIEDRVPLRGLGSGYVRSNDIVRGLAELGHQVTVYPVDNHFHSVARIYADFPDTVEVLFDKTATQLDHFLEERAGCFDLVWIGRTHNLNRVLPILHGNHRYLTGCDVILDTEVVAAPRTVLREQALDLSETISDLDAALRVEFENAVFCKQIVAVTETEAELIRRAGHTNLNILGHALQIAPTPASFSERAGLLFVGAVTDQDSPNLDSLLWFLSEVMPIIVERRTEIAQLTIAGYQGADVDMTLLSEFDNVRLVGRVDDLSPFYNTHRAFIAPTRFAGGIPYKIHESASRGLPVVASQLLIDELGWVAGRDILSGGAPNAEVFAAAVIALYDDESLWTSVRQSALDRIRDDCDPARFAHALSDIIEKARE